MSESPWTPGPWRWEWSDDDMGHSGFVLCGRYNETNHGVVGLENLDPSEADARLIAAAPEMAELLAWAAETESSFEYEVYWGDWAKFQDNARALLARVRGES